MSTEWISAAQAGAIVGCSRQTIDHYVRKGMITRRHARGTKTPSISRVSAEAFTPWWRQHVADVEARRRQPDPRPPAGPPDDGDVWLDSTTASLVVGVSPQYLLRLARDARLPATRDARRNKWWFRRRDIEQFAAMRAFERRQSVAS